MARTTNVYGLLDRLESAGVAVRQDRCTMVRNRNARCLKCAEACTSGCISFTGEELVVSPEKCIGCGTCATVCPTCALEARNPSDADLLARCVSAMEAYDGETVVITCERMLEARTGSRVARGVVALPCLGRVEESLVAELVARGTHKVSLVRGACESCTYAAGLQTAQLVCDTANLLLDAWGSSASVEVARSLPACVQAGDAGFYDAVGGLEALQCSRGEGATASLAGSEGERAAEKGRPTVADAADGGPAAEEVPDGGPHGGSKPRRTHVMADGTLPHFVPDRHERLLDALAELGEPAADAVIDTRLWGHVAIDVDACASCRMCAVFCPTGALSKFGDSAPDGGAFGVEHFPGDCVKCRCCENICPARALRVLDGVRARDLLEGTSERIEMRPVRVQKGGARSIMNSMRAALGMEEVYER